MEETPVEQNQLENSSPLNLPNPDFQSNPTLNSPVVPPVGPRKHRKHLKQVLALLCVVVLVGAGVLAGTMLNKKSKSPAQTTTSLRSSSPTSNNVTYKGYTFFNTPKPLGDLNFFKDPTQEGASSATSVKYAQIGTTNAGDRIVVAYDFSGGESGFYNIAIESSENQYQIPASLNGVSTSSQSNFSNNLNSNVSVSNDTIPGLTFPQTANLGSQGFKLADDFSSSSPVGSFIDGLDDIQQTSNAAASPLPSSEIKKVGQDGIVSFYEVTTDSKSNYQVKEVYGAIAGIYATPYVMVDPLITGDNTPPSIFWSDGSAATDSYSYAATGCGDPFGYIIANNIDVSQLTNAGTGPHGETIYDVPTSSGVFTDFYSDVQSENSSLASNFQNLTADQFQNNHGLLVVKNGLGEYVVYEDSNFVLGGCGKPVIYLYPTKPTTVSVKVGAVITKSSPTYPVGGWTDIQASPNGSLVYNGQNYGSLFWEGKGLGNYPNVKTGFVVAQAQLDSTLRSQLQAQGLKTNEINDFMSFWSSRLPKTPYVRLSWFDTDQMNELAPLGITPKPDTLIRVFLDYQGLQKPETIQPEVLHSQARTGFTVVEWGGLL